ncbi:MAG: hypothetical protein GH151_01245 [Bacteroidetes bacterium]|nr:hypothetical protein [Bacteroidota bacterium]
MYPGNIIKRDTFYRSNHRWFSCTDCHSPVKENLLIYLSTLGKKTGSQFMAMISGWIELD